VTLASLRRRLPAIPPVVLDAILYAASALFAVLLWYGSSLSAHRDWSRDAIVGYLACAAVAVVLAVVRPRRLLEARVALVGVCVLVCAVLPLVLMVRERAASHGREVHVLPEAAVIERAGARLAHGRDPYVAEVVDGRLVGQVAGVPKYEAFFPYFPLMAVLGLPASVSAFGIMGDARWWMALVTFLCLAAGLVLARPPPDRALRLGQAMLALPTGALFLAGGGDDLPVLAVCFLGLCLAQRRREVASGVCFGIAMAMKLTAWPLAALTLFVVRDRHGRHAAGRAGAVMASIVGVVLVPFLAWDPRTFLANCLEFPLGLSPINSPAADPLPGHLLTVLVPGAHRVLLVGLVVVGAPVLVWWLRRHPPGDVASVCRQFAVVAIVVMCVAPETRVGYVVYPVNLLAWAWMLDAPLGGGDGDGRDAVAASPAAALDGLRSPSARTAGT